MEKEARREVGNKIKSYHLNLPRLARLAVSFV
jgi:hypothetical protein